jgi:hypothetical protein
VRGGSEVHSSTMKEQKRNDTNEAGLDDIEGPYAY